MAKNKRNIILAILLVLILAVIALLIGRFTYSYIGAQVSEDLKSEGETTASGDTIIFSKGNNLSIAASTDNFYVGSGNLADTTNPSVRLIASNKTNEAVASYYAGIVINKNTFTYSGSNAELILTVRDENNNLVTTSSDTLEYVTVNGVSGFDITGKTGAFNIASNHPISTTSSTTGTTHTWTFTLTFVNLDTDQSINENATLDMEVVLQKDEIEMPAYHEVCTSGTMACDIAKLYDTDNEGSNGLYYHDGVGTYTNASQEAGDNSYRYSGANPNNYVCFGSDAATCPDDNLYRIIGLFDDDQDGNYQIKLIKNNAIGDYAWDDSNNNDWTKASLNNSLNKELFWNNLGEWQNMVSPTTWHLGGMNGDYDTKEYYEGERNNAGYGSNPTTYTDEIGLMYPSDYGYAASPENWTTRLSDYNNDTNTANNWMYMGLQEWTITPYSSNRYRVFNVNSHGYVSNIPADYGFAARPVFYLESNVQLEGGTGNSSDPYRIQI